MGDLDFFDPRHFADVDQTPGYEVDEKQFGKRHDDTDLVALRALLAGYFRDGTCPTGYEKVLTTLLEAVPYEDSEDEGEVTIDLRKRGLL